MPEQAEMKRGPQLGRRPELEPELGLLRPGHDSGPRLLLRHGLLWLFNPCFLGRVAPQGRHEPV